jgi:CheY-like chemotaxis protein
MPRVLLVEDDENQLAVRKMLLEHQGYEVSEARTAAEALSQISSSSELVLMDLSLPTPEEGLALVREINIRSPKTRIAVLTGWIAALRGLPEETMVAEVIEKSQPTRELLERIARLVASLLILLLPAAAKEYRFDAKGGETIAELELSSPGSDWGERGKEAAVARLMVDGQFNQHVLVFGERRGPYEVFLGALTPGEHLLTVNRDERLSAAQSALEEGAVRFRDEANELYAHAPVLFARADSVGKFSDVPLLVYVERLPAGLQYTVIFSNEDGGHSTRGLLARWGRTTDIEYVYRLDGATGFIQTRDHKDIPYSGAQEGRHPLLIPVTLNNMVEPGRGEMCFRLAPIEVDLNGHSREIVMDRNPWTYAVSSKELRREGRLPEVGDPRNYLYIEALVKNEKSRIVFKAKSAIDTDWRRSDRGDWKLAIERSGWIRLALEMPAHTSPRQIREFGFECLPENDKQPPEVKPVCSAERISAFFLTPDYDPGRPIELPLK